MKTIITRLTIEDGVSRRRFFVNTAGMDAPLTMLAAEMNYSGPAIAQPRNHSNPKKIKSMNTIATKDGVELKTYKGFSPDMLTTEADTINADLLAFIKS